MRHHLPPLAASPAPPQRRRWVSSALPWGELAIAALAALLLAQA